MKNSNSVIPSHLKKYIVSQNYKKYSPEDQAVWRFIMKGILRNVAVGTPTSDVKPLKDKGILFHKIPNIKTIDNKLKSFGWRAVCISGFIPPRAFMEFHKYSILPIASEIRTIEHIFYTPAPDIVHEAVGHVLFLDHPVFVRFLSSYIEYSLKAIMSQQDMEKYNAIRKLSDLKENPHSNSLEIKKQEKELQQIIQKESYISEAGYFSRLIWWTSEYGLIGSLKKPQVYGAGLTSSLGEFLHLKQVKKIRLSSRCIQYPFDITNFQPQLFVAKNFKHLLEVLEKLSQKLAVSRGGVYGIDQALKSQTLNTVVLDSGLQISGILEKSFFNKKLVHFLKFKGPVQLCYKGQELKGHGTSSHKEGYSTPLKLLSVGSTKLGFIKQSKKSSTKHQKPFFMITKEEFLKLGFKKGKKIKLTFSSNIQLEGEFVSSLKKEGKLLVVQFKNCLITQGKQVLYHPSWGVFDLAIGSQVRSVFSGPADPQAYPLKDHFQPSKLAVKKFSSKEKKRHLLYEKIYQLKKGDSKTVSKLFKDIKKQENNWLLFLELLVKIKEQSLELDPDLKKKLQEEIKRLKKIKCQSYQVFKMGQEFYNLKTV